MESISWRWCYGLKEVSVQDVSYGFALVAFGERQRSAALKWYQKGQWLRDLNPNAFKIYPSIFSCIPFVFSVSPALNHLLPLTLEYHSVANGSLPPHPDSLTRR